MDIKNPIDLIIISKLTLSYRLRGFLTLGLCLYFILLICCFIKMPYNQKKVILDFIKTKSENILSI